MGSESGCLPVPEERIVKKWRLQPGKMFLVDLEQGRIIDDHELKKTLAPAQAVCEWIDRIRIKLDRPADASKERREAGRGRRLLDRIRPSATRRKTSNSCLTPRSINGEEPIGSMGNDSPLAVLSNKNKTLYHYFKQLFAQVTNPPIDPIREELVTSLVSFIGPKPNLLGIDEMNPPSAAGSSQPVLDFEADGDHRRHRSLHQWQIQVVRAGHHIPARLGQRTIEARFASLAAQAEDAVRAGYSSSSSPIARFIATRSRSRRCWHCPPSTITS